MLIYNYFSLISLSYHEKLNQLTCDYIKINGWTLTNTCECGVLQGSTSGPLLFKCSISTTEVKQKKITIADDCSVIVNEYESTLNSKLIN